MSIKPYSLLFAGHRVDDEKRSQPRFPANKEQVVKAAIKEAVQKEVENISRPVKGLAGGANGGDILFHEVCAEVGISTVLYLPLPREEYIATSVEEGGQDWVHRFNHLYQALPKKFLAQSAFLIRSSKSEGENIWEQNNEWMLHSSLVNGNKNVTLLALWDGKSGDGAGGTQHLVQAAQLNGVKTVIININALL